MDDNTTEAVWWAAFTGAILVALWFAVKPTVKKHLSSATSTQPEPPRTRHQPRLERSASSPRVFQPTWSMMVAVALVSGVLGNVVARWIAPLETRKGERVADEVDALRDEVDRMRSSLRETERDVSSMRSELRSHEH